jgi:hypothetical protein
MTGDLLDFADERSRPHHELLGSSLSDLFVAIVGDISPKKPTTQIFSELSRVELSSVDQFGGKRGMEGRMPPGIPMKSGCLQSDDSGLKHRVIAPAGTGVQEFQAKTIFRRL